MGMNICVLSGYLYWPYDRDSNSSPENGEVLTSQGGNKYVRFTLRTDSLRKGEDGKYKKMNVDCIAYNNTAENLVQNFKKGSPIEVVGRLDLDIYEDRNGIKRVRTTIVVDRVNFPPREWEQNGNRSSSLPGEPKKRAADDVPPDPWGEEEVNFDDIPF
ncbi:single-strand binding protein [Desulfofundulus kuznetsovii DSM 6115]|uniref:Single-strand binding protein n=1 Tax=Desulfofundulus kuznetsovii (strain DSM 6115 / VKM B-1805 / 17) TaxID=760568 RepID=A0AAU8PLX1_DESK7|nr:single-strand binding protein [Desulfofundulus kuznetsovii DSM 6115]